MSEARAPAQRGAIGSPRKILVPVLRRDTVSPRNILVPTKTQDDHSPHMRAIAFPSNSHNPTRMRHWGPEKNLIHTNTATTVSMAPRSSPTGVFWRLAHICALQTDLSMQFRMC